MSNLERGIVKFFDSRETKRFGFIFVEGENNDIFLHINDGGNVFVGSECPSINTSSRPRQPGKGDEILFERSRNRQGPKAAPWCFAKDWEKAEQVIVSRTTYRLMKQTGEFRITRNPVPVWEGTNTDQLRAKFNNINLKLEYKCGTGGWEKYWFEKKVPAGWQRLEVNDDPRKIFLQMGRLIKPQMPLQVAWKILASARRTSVIDGIFGDSKIEWIATDKKVAEAYDGERNIVAMKETDDYDVTRFIDEEGAELMRLGTPAHSFEKAAC